MVAIRDDRMCFACSPHNPIGLKMSFSQDGDLCFGHFTPGENHQGWSGYLHGGLVATLLDEAMAQWLWSRGIVAMTAEMTVRYSRAIPIGVPVKVAARLTGGRKRLLQLEAEVTLPDGSVGARATAKFLRVPGTTVQGPPIL